MTASAERGTVAAQETNGDGKSPRIAVERVALTAGAVVEILWMNRPDSLNALDHAAILELGDALEAAEADASVRVVLISGKGRAFSAGGDLKAYLKLQRDPIGFPVFLEDLHRIFNSIRTMSKPVVALVNGVTAAGGLELLLCCDFAIAAASAKIGDAHLNFGQMGGGGVLAHLPRAIGPSRARELIFSARFLSADEARDWGLVNAVVADDKLTEYGLDFARGVAERSAEAVHGAKYVLNTGIAEGTGLDTTLHLERERTLRYCLTLPDSMEGLEAFARRSESKGGEA
ncbi:MAG: enoyl-CoA hydratase/isomerase family protein [Burkholderiales bacterium]